MLQELKKELNYTVTENGAKTHCSTLSHCLDLFATAGALRSADEAEIRLRFDRAFAEDRDLAMKLLFFARDVRGGLGERRLFRVILRELARREPETVIKNIPFVAEYGRFDDLLVLLDTPCEAAALKQLGDQLAKDREALAAGEAVSLLGKWLPSVNASNPETVRTAKRVAKALGMNDAAYRRTVSALRARIRIIENDLRCGSYTFDYEAQPSRAMLKYRKAFLRNDGERYGAYCRQVREGKASMHTDAVVPYDVIAPVVEKQIYASFGFGRVEEVSKEERLALDATWSALPDYTGDENSLVVLDGSGSMYGGKPMPIAVGTSLAIYFAERNRGAFHNHFITFSEAPRLVEIRGRDITERVSYCLGFNEVANTNLARVFELILRTAVNAQLPQEELPKRIYVVSDMEFDHCAKGADETNFAAAKAMFEAAGYTLPQIVFWNVQSRNTQQPVTMNERGVALVSGCSPRLFGMMMEGELSPYAQMLEILHSERYAPICA